MKKLKFLIPLAIFLGLAGFLLVGLGLNPREVPSPLIGKPAPAFELPRLDDPTQKVRKEDLLGKVWMLNVWASWCAACRDEHPVLTKFAETRRVRVVGYNWKDEPADALRWLEQFGNPFFVVLADQEGRYALDWGVAGAPETFLVDGSGIVRWKHTGPLTDEVVATRLLPALEQVERAQ